MVKKDFIKAVAERVDMKKDDIAEVMGAMSDVILEVIAAEDSIRFGNVCTFSGVTKPARIAHNPRSGEKIEVPEKHGYPKCKFTSGAKECD